MKTRNQLNIKIAAGPSKNATTSPNNCPPVDSPSNESSLTPRLRDRKPVNSDKASLNPPVAPAKSPVPTSSPKKSSGPVRVLPRRACMLSRPNNANEKLPDEQSSSPDARAKANSNSTPPTNSRSDGQAKQASLETRASDKPTTGTSSGPESLAPNVRSANVKNYSREIPPARPNLLSRVLRNDEPQDCSETSKLLKITLPENNVSTADVNCLESNKIAMTFNGSGKNGPSSCIDLTNSSRASADRLAIANQSDLQQILNLSDSTSRNRVFNILIGVTGSVATIKLVELVQKLKSMFPRPFASKPSGVLIGASIQIKIVMTKNSQHFATKDEILNCLNDPSIVILGDEDEWSLWNKITDPVLHIELRKWADLCLIAPLDANTMAKLANGICDNLLTCVVRAWDTSKPLIYCPAMNVHMYNHPLTREQLCKLQSFGYLRVDCVEKRLACGDYGMGGLAPVDSIANKVVESLLQPVSQRAPVTRPLLNQQPTYPIISRTESTDSSNVRSSLPSSINPSQSKFRFNTHVSSQAKNLNSIANRSRASSVLDAIASALKRPRKINSDGTEDIRRIGRVQLHNKLGQSNRKISGVTSLQNLKAMDSHRPAIDSNEEFDVGPFSNEDGYDFDPSNLLEQTMTTDDESLPMDLEPQPEIPEQSRSVRPGVGIFPTKESLGLTPILDTNKFLALCYNKDRGDFTCTICKHFYKNRKSMARHLKEQHVQGSIFHCKPCGVSYKRREKLIRHQRERHQLSL